MAEPWPRYSRYSVLAELAELGCTDSSRCGPVAGPWWLGQGGDQFRFAGVAVGAVVVSPWVTGKRG